MKFASRIALFTLFIVAPATSAVAQKITNTYYEDSLHGYRFKVLKKWDSVPVPAGEKEAGVITQMDGEVHAVRAGSTGIVNFKANLLVLRLDNKAKGPTTGPDATGGLRGRLKGEEGREDVTEFIKARFSNLRDFEEDKPFVEEEKKGKKILADHRSWKAFTGTVDIRVDTWTYHLDNFDICLLFFVPEDKIKKYTKPIGQVARSFEEIERVEGLSLDEAAGYEDLLAYHQEEAAQTPGWRAISTPSQKYIIKTSSDDKDFLEQVIARLERSRDIYERDFPPTKEFDHVSVVRVCKDVDEFHQYGNTRRGVAGWFNPATTELVLYDGKNVNRNMTYAVMSHEAFHQYCHFLFGESEAHRWFDEGHGDYYGGAEIKGRRIEITKHMPAGLERSRVIQAMVRDGTYAPIEEHINFSHSKWQGQGPSNVSCYAQSWSIVYMLRQGTLGKVSRKYWNEAWADILPSYVATLNAGFREKYEEIREKRRQEAEKEGEELSPDDLKITRRDLKEDEKLEIWKRAIEASWGQVDISEFEEKWKVFVKKL